MPNYSAGSEIPPSFEPESSLAHSVIAVCEPPAAPGPQTAGLERAGPDLEGAPHISSRLEKDFEGVVGTTSVCGTDERLPVPDATKYPFSAICFLEITFWDGSAEKNFIGTGFLYGTTVLYTSGHCIHDAQFGFARRIRVYPGRNGDAIPFGVLTSSSFYVPPEWAASHGPDFDYGAILLPGPGFTHSKFFGMESRPTNYLVNEPVRTAGYPGDKPYATPWMVEGKVATAAPSRFFYMLDTMGGQSGSPVFTMNMYGFGNHFTLGIHSYGGCPNGSTRVIPQMLERLPTRAS